MVFLFHFYLTAPHPSSPHTAPAHSDLTRRRRWPSPGPRSHAHASGLPWVDTQGFTASAPFLTCTSGAPGFCFLLWLPSSAQGGRDSLLLGLLLRRPVLLSAPAAVSLRGLSPEQRCAGPALRKGRPSNSNVFSPHFHRQRVCMQLSPFANITSTTPGLTP